jgi:formate-dependent nitrite reductase membrane component NrfD
MPPSDTFFTKSPEWSWLIILYFFFGGIAAGSFVYAAILDLFGRPLDRKLARLGYILSLPFLAVCPILLIVDLNRPERFLHMVIQDHGGGLMVKLYSPMSLGVWALLLFSVFEGLAFLGAMEWIPALGRGAVNKIIAVLGGVCAFVVAGYTGVLLSVTNRPIWADSPLIGALFLLSAATTAAAMLTWVGRGRVEALSLAWLEKVEGWVAILEAATLVATILTLGPVARLWANGWGVLLAAVVVFGLILPIFMHRRGGALALASLLTLAGGLVLRAVVILSSSAVALLLAVSLSGCVSPEAGRTRGGGPGADVGNHGAPIAVHGTTDPFHNTPLKAKH